MQRVLGGLWLVLMLGCGRTPTQPPPVSPCARLLERATAGCQAAAAQCTSPAHCLGALSLLDDPPGQFPSGEPCDRAILAQLARLGPQDVPALLSVIEAEHPSALDALQGVLPLTSPALEEALAANPSRTATAALDGISRYKHELGSQGQRDSARARFEGRNEQVYFPSSWQGPPEGIPRPPDPPLDPEAHIRAIEALRPEDDETKICSLGWPYPPEIKTFRDTRKRVRPQRVLDAFARLAATVHDPRARDCALQETFDPRSGALLDDGFGYGAVAGRYLTPTRSCSELVIKAEPDAWYFWRRGEVHTHRESNGLKEARIIPSAAMRSGRRRFRCHDVPLAPTPVPTSGGSLFLCEGGGLCFEREGMRRYLGGSARILQLTRAAAGDVFAIGAHWNGDNTLMDTLVVWHWSGAREKLSELVALPGEKYRWSFVDDDGAFIVGTEDGFGHGARFVTAVHTWGEEELRCW